jgi:hypothetical protein
MFKMKRLSLLLSTISICSLGYSQTDELTVSPDLDAFPNDMRGLPDPKVTFDFDIRAAFPTGEFKKFYPKDGMGGFGLTVLAPLGKHNPIDVGAGIGYYFMSQSNETFEYTAPGVGDFDITSRVSGSMVPFHLTTRIYPLKSTGFPVQPYVEVLAGFRLFIVNQRLETYIYDGDISPEPEVDEDVTGSWSYGVGGGLKVMLNRSNLLFLNLKVAQLYGTSTKNMNPATVVLYDDGSVGYSRFKSETDVLRFSIGLHLMLE